MAVFNFRRRSAASLLFDQNLRLKKRADVVGPLVGHTHFNRFDTLIPRRRIEAQAVPTGVQVCSAVSAFVGDLHLLRYLNLRGTIITSRNQVEPCFDATSRSLWTGRGFRPSFAIIRILISTLAILSTHLSPHRRKLSGEAGRPSYLKAISRESRDFPARLWNWYL